MAVKRAPRSSPEILRVTPLGGIGEIGKNMTVFEFADEIIVVDCGLAFPDEEMYGIDLVIADISYLKERRDKVKAFINAPDRREADPLVREQLSRELAHCVRRIAHAAPFTFLAGGVTAPRPGMRTAKPFA